jgi:hypothetical protein
MKPSLFTIKSNSQASLIGTLINFNFFFLILINTKDFSGFKRLDYLFLLFYSGLETMTVMPSMPKCLLAIFFKYSEAMTAVFDSA